MGLPVRERAAGAIPAGHFYIVDLKTYRPEHVLVVVRFLGLEELLVAEGGRDRAPVHQIDDVHGVDGYLADIESAGEAVLICRLNERDVRVSQIFGESCQRVPIPQPGSNAHR